MSTPTIIKRQKQSGCEGRYKEMVQVRVHNDGWNILTAIEPHSSNTLKINILLDYIMAIENETVKNQIVQKIFNLWEEYDEEHNNSTERTRFTQIQVNVDKNNHENFDNYVSDMVTAITYALTNLLECGFIIEMLKTGLIR